MPLPGNLLRFCRRISRPGTSPWMSPRRCGNGLRIRLDAGGVEILFHSAENAVAAINS
jgi:hypothetical protein